MQNPQYVTPGQDSIRLEREGGGLRVVDRDGPSDLFARAQAGDFGAVAPFDPALDVSPSSVREVEVTRLQAKAALLQMGLLDQVEALVGNLDQMTKLAWAETTTFRRDSALLNALGPYLVWPDGTALSGTDLDALFAVAETIEV